MWKPIDQAPINKMLAIIGTKDGSDILTQGVAVGLTTDKSTVMTAHKCTPHLFIELPESFSP